MSCRVWAYFVILNMNRIEFDDSKLADSVTDVDELIRTVQVLTSFNGILSQKDYDLLSNIESPMADAPRLITREMVLELRKVLSEESPDEPIFETLDLVAPAPRSLTIENNGRCNLACVQCPRHGDTREGLRVRNKTMIGLADFKEYVDAVFPLKDYRGLPTFEHAAVILYIQNEPLLDPFLSERTRYVGKKGLGCVISSNLNVPEQDVEFLLDPNSGVSKFICSVNSFDSETYDGINVGGSLTKVKRNLELLRKKPESLTVVVQMVVMSTNEHQVEEFRRYCEDLGLTPQIKSFGTHLERSPRELIPITSSVSRYVDKIKFAGRACARLWRGITVDVFGNQIMCSTSGYHPSGVMGSPKEPSDLMATWNSEAMQQLRFGLLNEGRTYKDICVGCDAFLPFDGVWKGAGV